jgi:hypothetical protein
MEKCESTIGGREECPTTGRLHVHAVCDFADPYLYRWLKYVFPDINIKNNVKSKPKAIAYAQKGGQVVWETRKPTSWEETPIPKMSSHEKAAEILRLAEDGDSETIRAKYPGEYLRMHSTISKLLASSTLKKYQERPNRTIDLPNKNLFIWGDAGTGKTWLAREICHPRPYFKGQNKWWDGWDNTYTGIVFNDLTMGTGFNWQTVLDAGDAYPFNVEIKNGSGTVDPGDVPVVCTSNYSPEELMEGWSDARKDALKRRFNFVRVEWVEWGSEKSLHWTFDPRLNWRPPAPVQWWVKKQEQYVRTEQEPSEEEIQERKAMARETLAKEMEERRRDEEENGPYQPTWAQRRASDRAQEEEETSEDSIMED